MNDSSGHRNPLPHSACQKPNLTIVRLSEKCNNMSLSLRHSEWKYSKLIESVNLRTAFFALCFILLTATHLIIVAHQVPLQAKNTKTTTLNALSN